MGGSRLIKGWGGTYVLAFLSFCRLLGWGVVTFGVVDCVFGGSGIFDTGVGVR